MHSARKSLRSPPCCRPSKTGLSNFHIPTTRRSRLLRLNQGSKPSCGPSTSHADGSTILVDADETCEPSGPCFVHVVQCSSYGCGIIGPSGVDAPVLKRTLRISARSERGGHDADAAREGSSTGALPRRLPHLQRGRRLHR